MRHLTLEAVARLVDEAPEPDEALHLRECLVCRRELAEMRTQTEQLARLADPEPSPHAWEELEARLAEEGLVRRRGSTAPREHPALRVAAAVALLVLGGSAGVTAWRGGGGPAAEEPAVVESLPAAPQVVAAPVTGPEPADAPVADAPVRTAVALPAAPEVRRAALPEEPQPAARSERPRREAGQESAALRDAERDYLTALAEYAELASAEDADPLTRLATLEGMVRATRNALERAPDDPVINGYHLAAMGQRDAMLRQIARSSEETWY